MSANYVIERQIRFLQEQRTEPYQEYGERAAHWRIGYGAKSSGIDQAMPGLGRSGT